MRKEETGDIFNDPLLDEFLSKLTQGNYEHSEQEKVVQNDALKRNITIGSEIGQATDAEKQQSLETCAPPKKSLLAKIKDKIGFNKGETK